MSMDEFRLKKFGLDLQITKQKYINYIFKNSLHYGTNACLCICLRTLSVPRGKQFPESTRTTVSFKEQSMSKDNYMRIFLKSNNGYCFCYPSIFLHGMQLGSITRISPSLSRA